MKLAVQLFCTAFLTLAVALYGAASSAGTMASASGASFVMVICADGGPQTIVLDANGAPVPQGQQCCDCLTCDHPPAGALAARSQVGQSAHKLRSVPCTATSLNLTDTHNARPMPRGPPAVAEMDSHDLRAAAAVVPVSPDLTQVRPGQPLHGGGRPSKDAS